MGTPSDLMISVCLISSKMEAVLEKETAALENKLINTGRILTAFGGSMARKEAERNTRYG